MPKVDDAALDLGEFGGQHRSALWTVLLNVANLVEAEASRLERAQHRDPVGGLGRISSLPAPSLGLRQDPLPLPVSDCRCRDSGARGELTDRHHSSSPWSIHRLT
nr:hypothetical protein [Rhodococcus sp. SGAir0479]